MCTFLGLLIDGNSRAAQGFVPGQLRRLQHWILDTLSNSLDQPVLIEGSVNDTSLVFIGEREWSHRK